MDKRKYQNRNKRISLLGEALRGAFHLRIRGRQGIKIMLKRNGEIVFNFDRGLDVPPADRDTETALAILLKEYN